MGADYARHIAACHACRHKRLDGSLLRCSVSGRSCVTTAESGDCPLGYFSGTPPPAPVPSPVGGLGDLAAAAIDAAGLTHLADRFERLTRRSCGCEARQEQLNRRGREWIERAVRWAVRRLLAQK